MAKKCVHKGCGQTYENEDEACVYHPGPPVFHEGQKGWKCCKPRVLTFDEFLAIAPCTTGRHSDVDDTPAPEPAATPDVHVPNGTSVNLGSLQESLPAAPRVPAAQAAPAAPCAPAPPPESDDDDPAVALHHGMACRRRGCRETHKGGDRGAEKCVHHPGAPIFHEGSKGWSCCKRRVLEFDQFMNIEGCRTKDRHLFVGSGKREQAGGEEKLDTVRHDYYQTSVSVVASLYLKKIDQATAVIDFQPKSINLDLRTSDGKRYQTEFPLFATIKPEESRFRILGTKLEMTLAKADGASWPVLRSDDKPTGEMIQYYTSLQSATPKRDLSDSDLIHGAHSANTISQHNHVMTSKLIAIVAGVGSGTGASVARKFSKAYPVVLLARNPENFESLAKEINSSGGKALGISTDVSSASSLASAVETIKGEFGSDVAAAAAIFNASGGFLRKPFLEVPPETFAASLAVSATGGVLFSQSFLPLLLKGVQAKSEHPPSLIFTGATASVKANAQMASFATGKWALRALSQSLAREFGPQGVHVAHAIIDGVIDIPRTKEWLKDLAPEAKLSADGIANDYWWLHTQPVTNFTWEIDLRPAIEKW
ncbi:hypothetical protein ACEQ8H_005348 [Pleosporales sp. CAS-2024a]